MPSGGLDMALNNYKLGDLLMRNSEENKDLIYGISDVRGVRNTKGISNTKIDVSGRNLKTFLVVRPGGFIFNHRVHDKLGTIHPMRHIFLRMIMCRSMSSRKSKTEFCCQTIYICGICAPSLIDICYLKHMEVPHYSLAGTICVN